MITQNDETIFREVCEDLSIALSICKNYNSILQRLAAPDPQILKVKILLEKYKIDSPDVKSTFGQIYLDGQNITNSIPEPEPVLPKLSLKTRIILKIKGLFR